MSAKPLISVLMPVLRPHAVYFPEAVRSLLEQSYQDWELVIVEDPSPETAEELLRKFPDSRIRYHCNPARTSFAEQLNLGLAQARGELVARLDADDVCEPNRLEAQVEYLQRHAEIAVLGSQLTIIDHAGRVVGWRRYPVEHAAVMAGMRRFNPLAHPSVMFRTDLVRQAGGYLPYPGTEDYELWARLARQGAGLGNHPEPLLRYRIHPTAWKATRLQEMMRGTLELKKRYWADSMNLGDRLRVWLERGLLRLPPSWVYKLFTWTQYQRRRP